MAFVTHGPNQRAYKSQSSVWSGPQKQGLKRAGRWLNSQAPLRVIPPQIAESVVWSRLPVLEALELHRWTLTPDAQPPRPAFSWFLAPKIAELAVGFPVELQRFVVGTDPFRVPVRLESPWLNLPRKGVKRAGRWVTSQPRQPRIVPESIYNPFDIVNIPLAQLPNQLRRFVTGEPFRPRYSEASFTKGIQTPALPPPGTALELYRFATVIPRQPKYSEASIVYHPQISTNADLYSVKRAIVSFVIYYHRFSAGGEIVRRTEFPAAFPGLELELHRFTTTDDRQPVQRPESALWIPQLQAAVFLPEELKRWVYGDDPVVLRQVLSHVSGVQIPNAAPPLPIELQSFVVVPETIVRQRGESRLLARYMPDTFPLPIELQQFLLTEPRQRQIIPQSSLTTRKLDELVAMPLELRHYVETAFQRYRSHYLILRGSFEPVPVQDVIVRYKYFRGYTIIQKDTRLES